MKRISLFMLLAAGLSFASTGLPNEITNLHFENVAQVSADVVWTTVHPSTSMVLIARDTNYEPTRQVSASPDPLVTVHRVQVDHLYSFVAPNQDGDYFIYVASRTADGTLSTAPGPQNQQGTTPLLEMRTLPANASGTPQTLFYTKVMDNLLGPQTAWTGHDMYFGVDPIRVAGPVAPLYVKNYGGYNNGTDGVVTFLPSSVLGNALGKGSPEKIHPWFECYWSNPSGLDSADQSFDRAKNLGFCNNVVGQNHGQVQVRLRVQSDAVPGTYQVALTLTVGGIPTVVTYQFNVVKTPTSVPFVAQKIVAPIPSLATWQSKWLRLADKWCTWQGQQDLAGHFVGSWGVQGDAWFYDGFRVFQQVDTYTTGLGQPNHDHWRHCAQDLGDTYAYWAVAHQGGYAGYSMFSHGLGMNYSRTGDPKMLAAITAMATLSSEHISAGSPDPYTMREAAYRANFWIEYYQHTGIMYPVLQRDIDKLIGYMDILARDGPAGIHPFMYGLVEDSLQSWWFLSVQRGAPDYRVVPTLQKAWPVLWACCWIDGRMFDYDNLLLPTNHGIRYSGLNNGDVEWPAFIWYMTGDPVAQQQANAVFAGALSSPPDYGVSGKVFSQMWEMSPNAVRLLQNNGAMYTDAAANPFEGPWPVTTPPVPFKTNCDPQGGLGGCVAGSISSTTATIFWQNYVPVSASIRYGLTTSYGSTVVSAGPPSTSSSIVLSGLAPHTTYHFRTKSVDAIGNAAELHDLSFTTAP
jgi:hypothetical protein